MRGYINLGEKQGNSDAHDRLTLNFIEQHGRECAYIPFARWQRQYYLAIAAGILLLLLFRWDICILLLTVVVSAWYLGAAAFRSLAALRSFGRDGVERVSERELNALSEDQLPIYTVLIPLYKEANIADRIVRSIERLDYPRDKLDVKLLLEADDRETQQAVAGCRLPACCEVIVVPEGQPRTKPRACNYGLEAAKGQFCVIYDAEDRPEPDQLRKAVAAFARLPAKFACVQAALNYFNRHQNWLTKWFTVEYSTTFDLYLPGIQTMGVPVPLGGTSNHFRTSVLKKIGGWDPFNVTEDCDIGIRLYKKGYATRMLDSTTWEEANSKPWNWIRQRSRWVKGFLQTHLVHMRHPLTTARQLGLRGTSGFFLAVGGSSFLMIVNVVYWVLGVLYLALLWHGHQAGQSLWGMIHGPQEAGIYRGLEVGAVHLKAWPLVFFGNGESPAWTAISVSLFSVSIALIAANFLFVLIHILACIRRKDYKLLPMAALVPLYWVMISIGAWKGGWQLLTRPSYWEKTNHGLDSSSGRGIFPALKLRLARLLRGASLFLFLLLLSASLRAREAGWHAGKEAYQRIADANSEAVVAELPAAGGLLFLQRDRHSYRASRSDFEAGQLAFKVLSVSSPTRAKIFVQDSAGLWFQSRRSWDLRPGRAATLSVPLSRFDQAFEPKGHAAQWHAGHALDRMSVGLSFVTSADAAAPLRVKCSPPRLEGRRQRRDLQIVNWRMPAGVQQRSMSESRFDLTREYFNPFDPEEIRIDVEIIDPEGKRTSHPAYFAVDCRRALVAGKERVNPAGMPYWAYRFTPALPGLYKHRLTLRDKSNEEAEEITTAWRNCRVQASDAPGFVRVDPYCQYYFAFENGERFYPLGFNLHAIYDLRGSGVLNQGVLPDYGTFSYDEFLEAMGQAGITATEFWMASWSMGLEWSSERRGYHGLGRYNMLNAWRLDYVIAAARKRGIYVHLVLDNHGKLSTNHDQEWDESPFNIDSPFAEADGAFLSAPADFFSNKRAMALTHQRNRYIAARWGQNPAIFGVELWSEVDLVADFEQLYHSGTYIGWMKTVLPQLRESGLRQLTTTHVSGDYGTIQQFDRLFQLEAIDYVVGDAYRERNRSMIDQLRLQDSGLRRFRKPRLITEYGGNWAGSSHAELEADIHAGLWASLFTRQAGAPMLWWHAYIHYKSGYDHYRVFAQFMEEIDLRKPGISYTNPPVKGGRNCQALAVGTLEEQLLWVTGETDMKRFPSPRQRKQSKIRNASVQLKNLRPGCVTVQWWDPLEGVQSEAQARVAKNGTLELMLPPFRPDIAAKILSCKPKGREQ